jgi:hypothetical protein
VPQGLRNHECEEWSGRKARGQTKEDAGPQKCRERPHGHLGGIIAGNPLKATHAPGTGSRPKAGHGLGLKPESRSLDPLSSGSSSVQFGAQRFS